MRNLKQVFAAALLGSMALLMQPEAARASCDHIKNDFAYNECLSKSAPTKIKRGGKAEAGADPETTVPERRRGGSARSARRGGAGVAISGRSGRVRAVIDPWSGARSAATRTASPRGRRRR